ASLIVVDERVAESFAAPGDEIERFMYGWSITTCLPDGRSREPSVATGTVMRPAILEGYARQAGFDGIEILPVENDFFRFYRLRA
ncbi:MAG TPA: SAM-dependent methyltransferase, partial [Candidatus Limnocylindria bacterium]